MELVSLNQNTWEHSDLVEGYSSLIWTERYLGAGDFTLKSRKVNQMREALPRKSKVSLRDSQEVMTVETHSIDPIEGGDEITITGRTFETILESRTTVIPYANDGAKNNMWIYEHDDIWPTTAARALIMSHLTVSEESPTQRVPNVAVANLIGANEHPGEQMSYAHEPGELYPEILRLLDMENAGIRCQLDNDGVLKIYIYRGVNRTVGQNDREPLVFSLSAEHVVDPKYLWSIKDYRNVAYVVSDTWQQRVFAPGVSPNVSGENRRILYVSASIKDEIKNPNYDPNPPNPPNQDEPGYDPNYEAPPNPQMIPRPPAQMRRQAKAIGLAALAKKNETFFFDAEVAPRSGYRRGVHYNLGDKVTLMAQYGVSQTMIVSEFVRTQDQNGERNYPTLITPNELEALL